MLTFRTVLIPMARKVALVGTLLLTAGTGMAADKDSSADSPLRFEKRVLTERYFCDGITAGDIN